MADTRELILDRLYRILIEIAVDEKRVRRNDDTITSRLGGVWVLLDGSEVVDDTVRQLFPSRGQISQPLTFIRMTPQLIVLVSSRWEDLGTQLNLYRSTLIKRIMAPLDSELSDILGTNGIVRYVGCTVNTPQSGERTEGRLEVNIDFTYPFNAETIA